MKGLMVFCTVPSFELAKIMSHALIKEKLAACINIIPKITSVYEWENEICEDEEFLLVIKTSAAKYPKLEGRILSTHPYDVPEVFAIPIREGSTHYLSWMEKILK